MSDLFKDTIRLVFFFSIILFVYGSAGLPRYTGVSLVVVSGATLQLQRTDFSLCGCSGCRAWASGVAAHGLSSCDFQALEHQLHSCGPQA